MESITLRAIGTSALMMNNPQTVDVLSPVTKGISELTGMRKRSEADEREMRRLKYDASLYMGDDGPYIPASWMWKAGQVAARKTKKGKMWEEGLQVRGQRLPLRYKGPRDFDGLYGDPNFVDIRDAGIGKSRIIVVRPIFPSWETEVAFDIFDEVINPRDVLSIMHTAARLVGCGTYRSGGFGRFRLELVSASIDLAPTCERLDIPMLPNRRAAA